MVFQTLPQTGKQTDQSEGMHSFKIHYFLRVLGARKMLERRKGFPEKHRAGLLGRSKRKCSFLLLIYLVSNVYPSSY